jgi:signal peptidase I
MSASVVRGSASHAFRREPLGFRRNAPRRAAAALLTAAIAGVCWWSLAPPSLGGTTSVAIVDGTSMLPRFHRGDLVLLRAGDHYRVGEVVAYRSRLLHRVVVHRIIKITHGHYVFKGDNNSWIDPEQPVRAELIGRQWLHIGQAGRYVGAFRTPPVLAGIAILLVLSVGLGGTQARKAIEPH